MGSQTGPGKTFEEMTPEERSEHPSRIFCTPDPTAYVPPHERQPADDVQEGEPQPPSGNGADDGAGQGAANGAGDQQGAGAKGAEQSGAFGTTEQDAPQRPCNRLLPEVEALKRGDPAALDKLLVAIFTAELSAAEHETLLDMVRKKVGFNSKTFDRVLRDYRVAPKPEEEDNPARPMGNPKAATELAPLTVAAKCVLQTFNREVVMGPHSATACTLWTVATYGADKASIFPRLRITSPTKRCGKSTLLSTVFHLAPSPLLTDNISVSALFRVIDALHPTLCVDEVDSFLKRDSDVPNIFNSGHSCDGCVIRSEPTPDGKSWVPTAFSTFAPIAYAGIGHNLPPATLDRSIPMLLQRAPVWYTAPDGTRQRRRRRLRPKEIKTLRAMLVPHLLGHREAIGAAIEAGLPDSTFPAALGDRDIDNWEPLLSVAALLGEDWPRRAREAAVALSTGGDERASHGEMLLTDLRSIMQGQRVETARTARGWWRATGRGGDHKDPAVARQAIVAWYVVQGSPPKKRPPGSTQVRWRPLGGPEKWTGLKLSFFTSQYLISKLNEMEDRPWPAYKSRIGGITPEKMAFLLKPFAIKPVHEKNAVLARRLGSEPKQKIRGYYVSAFRPVWKMYLDEQ